jgi:hypothetical protein
MNLDEAVRRARDVLARDDRGNLKVGARRAIWAALGGCDDRGRRARTTLAISTSEHVQPIWKATWPDDPLPERLVDLARQVLSGAVDTQRATREADAAQNRLDDLWVQSPGAAAVAAGYSAQRALFCALYDEAFDPNDFDVEALDENTQPDERDSSFLAAVACSGGPPWDPASRTEERRVFWLWWLDEAVATAARGTT